MVTEVGAMAYRWPEDTDFALWELDVLDRDCPVCGRMMHICDHRYRRVHTLDGPVQLICKLNHCPDRACPGHARTKSPELEITIALPQVAIGWDVFCWLGHRRSSRHMAISLIRSELLDDYAITLSDDAIDGYIRRYQVMLAARQQDPESLRREYESAAEIILSIDGLQPEKGHETLSVVRALTRKRVWFAEPLLSSAAQEVHRVIVLARQWAERLGKPVRAWMSDKQEAFVKAIATEFPGIPTPRLPQPLCARCGQASPRHGQASEGHDAQHSARIARHRTTCFGRASASESREMLGKSQNSSR